jgi:hypothetical protein
MLVWFIAAMLKTELSPIAYLKIAQAEQTRLAQSSLRNYQEELSTTRFFHAFLRKLHND